MEKENKRARCSTDNISHTLSDRLLRDGAQHITDAEPETTIGVINIRGSFKRTADSAGLNEIGEGIHRLKKAQREGQ